MWVFPRIIYSILLHEQSDCGSKTIWSSFETQEGSMGFKLGRKIRDTLYVPMMQ